MDWEPIPHIDFSSRITALEVLDDGQLLIETEDGETRTMPPGLLDFLTTQGAVGRDS